MTISLITYGAHPITARAKSPRLATEICTEVIIEIHIYKIPDI